MHEFGVIESSSSMAQRSLFSHSKHVANQVATSSCLIKEVAVKLFTMFGSLRQRSRILRPEHTSLICTRTTEQQPPQIRHT